MEAKVKGGGHRESNILDMEIDTLIHCANYLDVQDVSNMAMTCKLFNGVAYSNPIWRRLYREHWPHEISCRLLQSPGIRNVYLERHTAIQQFRFENPCRIEFFSIPRPYQHILLEKDGVILSQDSKLINVHLGVKDNFRQVVLKDHKAKITCMRSFPLKETSLLRSEAQRKENFLVTSSSDHSIRLWWKGSCQRCYKGHNGPVTTLADKLLGDDCNGKVLASGGEDGTVRLWPLSSSGKRGQHALRTTFYGHEKTISFLSVSGHKTSLLVSISRDAKIKVWDITVSANHNPGCVGMSSLLGTPVGLRSHESLTYVAAGSVVTAIDLRTMQKAFTPAIHQSNISSFEILPSKSVLCTGGDDKALFWDIRKSGKQLEPVAELDGHTGPVSHLHMDSYKVVTGTRTNSHVNIWETDTGRLLNTLNVSMGDGSDLYEPGLSAMAVNGSRIVTTTCGVKPGLVYFRDYETATIPISLYEDNSSKFWEPHDYIGEDMETK